MTRRRQLRRLLATSFQLDVTLENAPQILVQLVIVLLVATVTFPFLHAAGLEGVFDTHNNDDDNKTFSQLLFYLSIAWSVRSIHSSLFATYLYRKEHSVGDLGKVLLFVRIFLESSGRILALILSLAPFLGLFDLMLPHHVDTRLAYSPQLEARYGHILAKSRDVTWYTGISFPDYLVLLLSLPAFHIVLVVLLKLILVPQFLERDDGRRRGHLLVELGRAVVHASSSLLVPALWRDWDEPSPRRRATNKPSSQPTHEVFWRQWLAVRREYQAMVVLQCAENLVLLLPALCCCWQAVTRSRQLPHLPEEDRLLGLYYTILLASPVWFILSALAQDWLFAVFNLRGHPWAMLLQNQPQEKVRKHPQGKALRKHPQERHSKFDQAAELSVKLGQNTLLSAQQRQQEGQGQAPEQAV